VGSYSEKEIQETVASCDVCIRAIWLYQESVGHILGQRPVPRQRVRQWRHQLRNREEDGLEGQLEDIGYRGLLVKEEEG
jgi:hypothetical protein